LKNTIAKTKTKEKSIC